MDTDDIIGSYQELLERVDEYTLYCFYLGFAPELDMQYCSPIREDDIHPSWTLYLATKAPMREFMWKDKGGKGMSGDIFKLVRVLFGYGNQWQVIARIKSDFGLGPEVDQVDRVHRIISPNPTPKADVDIRVRSRAIDLWDRKWWMHNWNISDQILKDYKVSGLKYFFTRVGQKEPMFPKDRAYVYTIMGKYKLYFPLEGKKQYRFIGELSERELEGVEQLHYDQDLLVITKSYKDVMSLRSFGYEAVCPRGESTIIPENFLSHFEQRYRHIVLLFDNDGKHKAEAYRYPKVWIPLSSGTKDISDFNKKFRPLEAGRLLHQLFEPWEKYA